VCGRRTAYIIDVTSGDVRTLKGDYGHPHWSPDGAYFLLLTFPTAAPVQTQLQVWDLNGNVVSAFAENINIHYDWNPGIDWVSPPE
jgi:hypothetical protein